jgi:hypothetical protein
MSIQQGCTPCSFSAISTWTHLKPNFAEQNTGILLIINNPDEQSVLESLKENKITVPFVFDNKRIFKISNLDIFSKAGNIFVIDRDKNVIFTESPIKDEKTWKKFIKRIGK